MKIIAVALGTLLTLFGTSGVAAANTPGALEQRSRAALADTEAALEQLWMQRVAQIRASAASARDVEIDADELTHQDLADTVATALDDASAQRAHARSLAAGADARAGEKGAEADAAADVAGALAKAIGTSTRPAFAWPTSGRLSSPFGPRGKEFHDGIDIATPLGTPVIASAAGIVVAAGQPYLASGDTAFGVIVDHGNGFTTLYWHLAPVLAVRTGQRVEAGTALGVIGLTGRVTGPHLHYGMFWSGRAVDPARILEQSAP